MDTGTLRQCLSLDAQSKAGYIIEKKQKSPNYYMLIWSDFDPVQPNRINTRIITMNLRPEIPMLGTILMYVDNKRSKIDTIWNLPLDIPVADMLTGDKPIEEVGRSSVPMKDFILNTR